MSDGIVTAYHFTNDTLRGGRPVPPVGEWLEHDDECVICESGLHASRHPFDALLHAPGPYLHLVECDGVGDEEHDKLVCRRRKIVATIDATDLLHRYAKWCALQVVHLWDPSDVVMQYLETGRDDIRAAASTSARAAAAASAWGATWGAAWAVAWAAASPGAAPDAVRSAAWAAAWAAGSAAARAAASADESADARVFASAAAWDAQRARLQEMVDEAFKHVFKGGVRDE